MPRKLSDETIAKIKELHADGVSNAEIARRLEVSLPTLRSYLPKQSVGRPRKMDYEERRNLRKMFRDKVDVDELAETFGISKKQVYYFARKDES